MWNEAPRELEAARLTFSGDMRKYNSKRGAMSGAFRIISPRGGELRIISSGKDNEFGWEHVSVSLENRTPLWSEMCFIKDLFWPGDEAVMQIHPTLDQYVNHHPFCLHLWRPLKAKIPLPPTILVGPT